MNVFRPIHDNAWHEPRPDQPDPPFVQSSVAIATRHLGAALRIWDENQAQAKSRIKVAVAVLQNDTGEPPMQEKPPGRVTHRLVPWQVRKVREFIDASLDSKIRLHDCATRTRLSTSHFSRVFKATFGTTALTYIHQRRVERAQYLMLTSEQPLSEIALSCGFGNQAHYCRVFRAIVGLSPNVWRRRNMLVAPNDWQRSCGAPQGHRPPAAEASITDGAGRT
jgi:AraC-like DNA-binding protein